LQNNSENSFTGKGRLSPEEAGVNVMENGITSLFEIIKEWKSAIEMKPDFQRGKSGRNNRF
jgi:hypothetical protein